MSAPLRGADAAEFTGFPNSGLATAVPNLFFARVLPAIERPEELIVTLYFFFAQRLKRRWPRFLTRAELAADATLVHSLARLARCDGQEALARGLDLAAARGTLFRVRVGEGESQREAYLVNNPANRKGILALRGELPGNVEEPLPAVNDPPENVFTLYEANIGPITPLIAEELKDADDRYPAPWLREAMREAVANNKRSWRYVHSILKRWETEGPDHETSGRDPELEWLERRYREGKRRVASGGTGS